MPCTRTPAHSVALVTLLVWPLAGCVGAPAAPDAAVGADAGPGGVEISFRVLAAVGSLADPIPLEQAQVVVDQADGARIVGSTGPDGRAVVSGVSFDAPLSVTFWAPGYMPVSITDVLPADIEAWRVDGDVLEVLGRVGAVPVEGTATNMADPTHALLVSTRYGHTPMPFAGGDYVIQATPGVPLELVAIEMVPAAVGTGTLPQPVRWGHASGAPITSATTLDVDLVAGGLTPRSFSGTIESPDFFGTTARTETLVIVDGAIVGVTTAVDGTRVEGEYVELETSPRSQVLTQVVAADARGRVSAVLLEGYPSTPFVANDFPPPPVLVDPADPRGLTDPITAEAGEPGLLLVMAVRGPEGPRWLGLTARTGASTLRLPELPEAARLELTGDGAPLTMQIYFCEVELPHRQRYCRRVGTLPPVAVRL